jgi:hypothetical protein
MLPLHEFYIGGIERPFNEYSNFNNRKDPAAGETEQKLQKTVVVPQLGFQEFDK